MADLKIFYPDQNDLQFLIESNYYSPINMADWKNVCNRLKLTNVNHLEEEQEGTSFSPSKHQRPFYYIANNNSKQSTDIVGGRDRRSTMFTQWLRWFKPLNHLSLGFMPVRGRKASFIAARGKKNAAKSTVFVNTMPYRKPNQPESTFNKSNTNKLHIFYYLTALTIKPLSPHASSVNLDTQFDPNTSETF